MRWQLLLLTLCILIVRDVIAQDDSAENKNQQKASKQPLVQNMFNCQRPGIECFNNATCDDAGDCICMDGYVGLGCEYNETLVSNKCDECGNGASCIIEDDDSVTCICTEAFFGDKCDMPRAKLKCNPNSMEVMIAPLTNTGADFSGVIYVVDQAADDGCFLNPSDDYPGGYSAVLDLEQCGGAENETDDEGNTDRFFSVLVQYNSLIQTDMDQIFVFACNVLQSGQDQSFDTNVLSSDAKKNPLDKQKVKENLKPVTLQVLDANEEQIKSPVTIGDVVSLQYTLNGGDVYDSFKVMEVVATNGLQGDAEESLTFVRDGCVTPEAGKYGNKVVQDLSGDPTSSVTLKFKAFKFLRSYKLSFRNTVKLCKEDGNCNVTVCEEFENLGRRRRAVPPHGYYMDGENEIYKEYNNTILIYRPHRPSIFETSVSNPVNQNDTNMILCLTHPGFLILFICVIVLLVIVTAIIALCCVRASHRTKDNDQGFVNKAFS